MYILSGITNFTEVGEHLTTPWFPADRSSLLGYEDDGLPGVHGVMIGRAAYNNPLLFMDADSRFFGVKDPAPTRRKMIERYVSYCERLQTSGPRKITHKQTLAIASSSLLLKPMHKLFNGCDNATLYKQLLNDLYVARVKAGDPNPSCREVVEGAMESASEADLDGPVRLRTRTAADS